MQSQELSLISTFVNELTINQQGDPNSAIAGLNGAQNKFIVIE